MSQNLPDLDALWDYAHPDQTEARFLAVLKRIPQNDFMRLEVLTQIARAQGLQGKFAQAHKTLDQVKENLGAAPSRANIRYLLERGRVCNSAKQPGKAVPFFEEALNMAKRLREDFYAVDAIHMLAISAPLAESLRLNLQALELAESSPQEKARSWLGSLYNNIGWAYHDTGDFKAALKTFKQAEAFRRKHGTAERRRIATWCVARTLRSLKRVAEALAMQTKLEKELETLHETDGYVFEEIGECLLLLKREKDARPYFAKAYAVLAQDKFLAEQEPGRIARLKKLGRARVRSA